MQIAGSCISSCCPLRHGIGFARKDKAYFSYKKHSLVLPIFDEYISVKKYEVREITLEKSNRIIKLYILHILKDVPIDKLSTRLYKIGKYIFSFVSKGRRKSSCNFKYCCMYIYFLSPKAIAKGLLNNRSTIFYEVFLQVFYEQQKKKPIIFSYLQLHHLDFYLE